MVWHSGRHAAHGGRNRYGGVHAGERAVPPDRFRVPGSCDDDRDPGFGSLSSLFTASGRKRRSTWVCWAASSMRMQGLLSGFHDSVRDAANGSPSPCLYRRTLLCRSHRCGQADASCMPTRTPPLPAILRMKCTGSPMIEHALSRAGVNQR